jgi:hypothetical protein
MRDDFLPPLKILVEGQQTNILYILLHKKFINTLKDFCNTFFFNILDAIKTWFVAAICRVVEGQQTYLISNT